MYYSFNKLQIYKFWSGNGIDYASTPINATFHAGTTSSMISVPITKDNILEQWETFQLNFTISASTSDVVIAGRQTTAIGVIIDNTSELYVFLCI